MENAAPPVTLFSVSQLADIVRDTLVTLPPEHTSAIVGIVDARGVQVVAQFKRADDRWTVLAAATHEWTGNNAIGARVMLSW